MNLSANKILFIVADGNPGGGTTLVLDMLKTLAQMPAFSCCLITQSNSYALEQSRQMGLLAKGLNFFSSRLDLRVSYRLHKLIASIQPDLVHIHGGRAAFFSSFASIMAPTIYTVHGLHAFYYGSAFTRFLFKTAERKSMRAVNRVVFVSQAEREMARKSRLLFRSNDQVILNGMRFETLPLGRPQPRVLGFIGRFCKQKDPLFLLDVMRILSKEGFILFMIGGGQLESAVREKVEFYGLKERVKITGELSREQALTTLSQTEVLLMPSRWEAFGLVAIEAMALGIPVVASKLPPLEEVIQDGKTGILISNRDPKEYAQAIRTLYKYPKRRRQIVDVAQKDVSKRFGWGTYMKSYVNLYQELLNSKRPRPL